ncbi:reverse transcriptase domain-containing protein [Tanacetum coccineum]|uniref:Reverse transcriptase domain-containing protein n=1 Tax=Tanacetum coccineum TaxID=301880 RepID=A0ABQ5D9V1_9ASTR
MVPATTYLIGFSGETIWPLGQIALIVKIGDEVHSTSVWMNFIDEIHASDMTGVPRSIAEHRLIIQEGYSPVRQKEIEDMPRKEIRMKGQHTQRLGIRHSKGDFGRNIEINLEIKTNRIAPRNEDRNVIGTTHPTRSGSSKIITPMEKVCCLDQCKQHVDKILLQCTLGFVVITDHTNKATGCQVRNYGRMLKWMFVLEDFIVETTEEGSPDELMAEPEVLPEPWTLFTDGSSCEDGSGAGLILTNPERAEFTYAMRFRIKATNNEAEYEALIAGLRIAEQIGVKNLQAHVDSRLVANQVNGSYIAKESCMVQYLNKVKTIAKSFKEFSIKQIPRSENKKAYALSKIASTSFAHLSKQVLVEELKEKSINEKEILDVVEEEGN